MEEKLIAPCGMNCSLCISYQSGRHDLKSKGFSRSVCAGCLPRGKNCVFLKESCEKLGNGLVRFCFVCEEFPCRRLKALDKRYRTKYHMSMVGNLMMIRDSGLGSFLEEEKNKWSCPRCGEAVCCHNGLCLNCDLATFQNNRKYRWGER